MEELARAREKDLRMAAWNRLRKRVSDTEIIQLIGNRKTLERNRKYADVMKVLYAMAMREVSPN